MGYNSNAIRALSAEAWQTRLDNLIAEAEAKDKEFVEMITRHLEDRLSTLKGFSGTSLSGAIKNGFSLVKWQSKVDELIEAMGVKDKKVIKAIHEYVEPKIAKILGLAELMDEEDALDDLKANVTYWYVETKSEWFQFNTRIGYYYVKGQEPDTLVLMMGTIGSSMLEEIENIFLSEEVEVLTDYLHAPLPNSWELDTYRRKAA